LENIQPPFRRRTALYVFGAIKDYLVVVDPRVALVVYDNRRSQLKIRLTIYHMDLFRIKACYELFDKLKCCSGDLNGDFSDDAALALVQVDKMRCHTLNCLVALSVVLIQKKLKQKVLDTSNEKYELVKRKVFRAVCLMTIDAEFDTNKVGFTTMISSFPHENKMLDERSWLPMHFAIALFVENKITEEDVHLLHIVDPLAMYHVSKKKVDDEDGEDDEDEEEEELIGYTPAHLLIMQKQPIMKMVRYFCLRDPKAFLLCDQSGRCALHLAAQYSESVELLQTILQIDQAMTKRQDNEIGITPLGLLCRRLEFPTFREMVACLLEVDSSEEVVYDAIYECRGTYVESESKDPQIFPGSRGERMVTLLSILLEANLDALKHRDSWVFHHACEHLRGELGVVVLSSFLAKNSTGVRVDHSGYLPIHYAAMYSSLDVMKLLQKAYPESLSMLGNDGNTLLHTVFYGMSKDITNVRDKVQYLCDQCPAFIHQKNNNGDTPLHSTLANVNILDIDSMICLCKADGTVVRDKCTSPDSNDEEFEQLPLHFLIACKFLTSEISDEADCFRLFLSHYPASAGIKDGHLISPYDLAVSENLSVYFIRLLLNADPTIDPVRKHNLNFDARRDGMFLAFRALSGNLEPTIWAKIRYEGRDLLSRVISYL
jgi:ankyrin repeat protein